VLHGFLYIGLAVLIPAAVSPQLAAPVFARGLAYSNLAAATLALIALAALSTRLTEPLLWILNIFGTADLLNAFYQGNHLSLADTPGLLGSGYFIPIFWGPSPLGDPCSCVQVAHAQRGRRALACCARRQLKSAHWFRAAIENILGISYSNGSISSTFVSARWIYRRESPQPPQWRNEARRQCYRNVVTCGPRHSGANLPKCLA